MINRVQQVIESRTKDLGGGMIVSRVLPVAKKRMGVFEKGSKIDAVITKGTHCSLIGGEAFPSQKFIWWNLVSSSKEKISQARENWNSGSFPQVPMKEIESWPRWTRFN